MSLVAVHCEYFHYHLIRYWSLCTMTFLSRSQWLSKELEWQRCHRGVWSQLEILEVFKKSLVELKEVKLWKVKVSITLAAICTAIYVWCSLPVLLTLLKVEALQSSQTTPTSSHSDWKNVEYHLQCDMWVFLLWYFIVLAYVAPPNVAILPRILDS